MSAPPPPPQVHTLKNDLPQLASYELPVGKDYWNYFKHNPLPNGATTPIQVKQLQEAYNDVRHLMSECQTNMGDQVISDLTFGADTLVDEQKLPQLTVPNPPMSREDCIHLADSIATWLNKGFVAGPFDRSPLDNLRTNPIFVISRNGKHRPILDMSSPPGSSFNDAIIEHKVPKLVMANPKTIADQIYPWGPSALLSKLDMEKAFKLIPVKPSQWRLQGFSFLGKIFIETQAVFGSKSSPALFDRLHELVILIAVLKSNVDPCLIHKTLDDCIIASPFLQPNKLFIEAYIGLCKKASIPLAPLGEKDKAFLFQKSGVILGIDIEAERKLWRIPQEKAGHHMRALEKVIQGNFATLKQLQVALGMTLTVTQMMPVLKSWTFSLISSLREAKTLGSIPVSHALRATIHRWLRVYHTLSHWHPLSPPSTPAALGSLVIGTWIITNKEGRFSRLQIYANTAPLSFTLTWPEALIRKLFVNSATRIEHAELFLESVALLTALFLNKTRIRNTHFLFFTRNTELVTAMAKGRKNRCRLTSFIIEISLSLLVVLNAQPDFRVGSPSTPPIGPSIPWPQTIASWLRTTRTGTDLAAKLWA